MYSQGQTLRHKETNRLVRMVPQPECASVWHWPDKNGYTQFYNKCGAIFVDKLSNYTHIEDELGRAVSGKVKEGEFVDTSLKRYLVSEEELAVMREKRLEEWANEVETKLKESNFVRHPFADGSHSSLSEKYFLEKYNAKPLHKSYNDFRKEYNTLCGQYVMKIHNRTWIYIRGTGIKATSLEYLKEVIKSLE